MDCFRIWFNVNSDGRLVLELAAKQRLESPVP
jgi:hypothetical protein